MAISQVTHVKLSCTIAAMHNFYIVAMYFTRWIIMVPAYDNSSPKQHDLQPGKKKKSQTASSNAGHSQSRYWECRC